MKIPRFGLGETLLGLSVAGLFTIAAILASRAFAPPPVVFKAWVVIDSPPAVVAEAARRNVPADCRNGVQADLRDGLGALIRLPVPARVVQDDMSRYPLVIPAGTPLGQYQVRLSESLFCQGKTQVVEGPWLPLRVK